MRPLNQDQHKVPVVYLKKFGYLENDQWKVSVMHKSEKFTRQKSIGSFTAETNFFDIDSYNPALHRMFEELNGELETEYNNIINDLDNQQTLSDKSYAYLIQIIVNFMARSDYWRDWIIEILNSENKINFLRTILGHLCKDIEEFKMIEEKPFFKILIFNPPKEVVNRVLFYFMDYLLLRLQYFDIVIIQSQKDTPWWTSTNPIVVHNQIDKINMDFFTKESEIYFPLSPKYLAYVHFKGSTDKENPLRQYASNMIYQATDEQNENLQHLILENAVDFVIIHGLYKYKIN